MRDWPTIWLTFAGYALILGIVFPLVFNYRHSAEKMGEWSFRRPEPTAGIRVAAPTNPNLSARAPVHL